MHVKQRYICTKHSLDIACGTVWIEYFQHDVHFLRWIWQFYIQFPVSVFLLAIVEQVTTYRIYSEFES